MKAPTKFGLSAAALLIMAGGVATMNDMGQDEYGIHYMAGWAPDHVKTVSAQWGVQGNVRGVTAVTSPFDKKGVGHRGDVAFTFIKLPPHSHRFGTFWCSVTVHDRTERGVVRGNECYVAVQV